MGQSFASFSISVAEISLEKLLAFESRIVERLVCLLYLILR